MWTNWFLQNNWDKYRLWVILFDCSSTDYNWQDQTIQNGTFCLEAQLFDEGAFYWLSYCMLLVPKEAYNPSGPNIVPFLETELDLGRSLMQLKNSSY